MDAHPRHPRQPRRGRLQHVFHQIRRHLQTFLGSADANTEQDALRRAELRELFAVLSERERQVLFLRYFRDRTQSEVGQRLGLSQVQISRIEKKALLRMRQQGEGV